MQYSDFRKLASVLLSTYVGFLIFLPWVSAGHPSWLLYVGLALGALIGFRQRKVTFFFYIVLAAATLLTFLVYREIFALIKDTF
ncbi:MAG TPA: hypothetical protein PKD37_02450 [Oligoflexia bacterium]|nr:hypothetical protein [Oligoflexia bacterium]HMP26831.1 hypothetical protein [Oligoflexia bacterium]